MTGAFPVKVATSSVVKTCQHISLSIRSRCLSCTSDTAFLDNDRIFTIYIQFLVVNRSLRTVIRTYSCAVNLQLQRLLSLLTQGLYVQSHTVPHGLHTKMQILDFYVIKLCHESTRIAGLVFLQYALHVPPAPYGEAGV